jgi:hypothetical protein
VIQISSTCSVQGLHLYLQIAWSQSTPEVSSSFRYSVGPRTQTLTCTSFAHLAMTLSFHPEFCNVNKCSFQCHHSSEFKQRSELGICQIHKKDLTLTHLWRFLEPFPEVNTTPFGRLTYDSHMQPYNLFADYRP